MKIFTVKKEIFEKPQNKNYCQNIIFLLKFRAKKKSAIKIFGLKKLSTKKIKMFKKNSSPQKKNSKKKLLQNKNESCVQQNYFQEKFF